ncbi:MAG TPA: AMP-binding protein [Solirubrobacterales bacterium]|nr:AMP-binding protein [Solirubrobacterales bacterium]
MASEARLGWALDQAALRRPEAIAVIDESGRVTFGELRDLSNAIATQLLEGGVGAGDVVTFALPNVIETVAAAAAIWRIGAVSNPVVTLFREHEFAYIVGQLQPAAVISGADIRGRNLCAELDSALAAAGCAPRLRLRFGGEPLPGWDELGAGASSSSFNLLEAAEPAPADHPCLVLYTSGTTSDPKAVLHNSSSLLQEVASMQRTWGLTFRDRMLMASPLTHITGLLQGLLVPCLIGGAAVLLDRWDPAACVAAIESEGATYMAGATPFLQGVLGAYDDAMPAAGPSLRQYCCGGAAVPPDLIEAAERIGVAAYRCWGMTELPTATLASERDPLDRRARTDGRIAEGVEVETVDEERRPLPIGTEGELRLRGPERMIGYLRAGDNEAALDAEGWFYSGDLGVIDEAGYVSITGRLKDIINRGGEKLSTREIEELILRHEAVSDAAVIPVPDERLGEEVCAVIVTDGSALADDELIAFLRAQKIAVQKLPRRIERVDELPRTASGKVRKQELIERMEVG